MTNAELIQKIRDEIERRFIEYNKDSNHHLQAAEDAELLSLLDTIEESEKPMNQEGLEDEMDKFFETMPVLEHENIFDVTFQKIARHFAEWGAEHLAGVRKMIEPEKKEGRTDCSSQGEVPNDSLATQSYENIPKDLEEAVEKQIDEALFKWSYDDEDGIEQYVHDAFIAGAKWQKEQDDRLVDIIYQQGVEKGKDEIRKTLKRKEKK